MKRRKKNRMRRQLLRLVLLLSTCVLTIAILFFIFNSKKKVAPTIESNVSSYSQKKTTTPSIDETTEFSSSSNPQMESSESEDTQQSSFTGRSGLNDQELSAYAGKVGYGVFYFRNDSYYSNNNNDPFIAASIIKVFIMDYFYENNLTETTVIDGTPVVHLIEQMIQVSDNTAANQLIDYVGMDTLNSYFKSAGYHDTVINRRMLDEAAQAQGLENYTSVPDAISFLKKLYFKKELEPNRSMLTIMEGQQINTKIKSQLPESVIVANKTGELASVENDMGIVLDDQNPFAIVVLTNQVTSPGAEQASIGTFALEAWQKND